MRKSNKDGRMRAFPGGVFGFLGLIGLSAGLALSSNPASAQFYADFKFDRYKDCVREVSINAEQAYETASRWRAQGGGAAAMHCEALALSELNVYRSAAKLLERLAKLDEVEAPEQKAEIFGQAGHAWLLADKAEKARNAFDQGLAHVSLESHALVASELMIGIAHGFGLEEKWSDAIDVLNGILVALPQQYDALILRASMRRAEGDIPGAGRDIAQYLVLMPDEVDGLMERGFLRMDVLDLAGAKADFERVMELAPESRAALQAQAALSKIAFRTGDVEE